MRLLVSLLALSVCLLSGCAVGLGIAEVVTYPLDKKETFKETQKKYTANIRYGLFEDAHPSWSPSSSRASRRPFRFRELRFSDFRIESIDIDPAKTRATAVVQYRGYWLSSPYEREIRVVQRWRRQVPTQNWYVTPDFDTLLGPAGG